MACRSRRMQRTRDPWPPRASTRTRSCQRHRRRGTMSRTSPGGGAACLVVLVRPSHVCTRYATLKSLCKFEGVAFLTQCKSVQDVDWADGARRSPGERQSRVAAQNVATGRWTAVRNAQRAPVVGHAAQPLTIDDELSTDGRREPCIVGIRDAVAPIAAHLDGESGGCTRRPEVLAAPRTGNGRR